MKKFCSLFCLLLICVFTTTMFAGCKKAKQLVPEMVTLEQTNYVYDGTEKKPKVTITVDGKVVDGKNYSVSYFDNVSVGQATARIVSAKKSKKITGTLDVHFTISAKDFSEISQIESKVYNGENQIPLVEIPGLTQGVDYSLSWEYKKLGEKYEMFAPISGTEFINAGEYRVTATGLGNFGGTKTAIYVINPATLSEILPVESKVYNGENQVPEIKISNLENEKDFVLSYKYKTLNADENEFEDLQNTEFVNAGDYKITATGIGNYSGTVSATYQIQRADYQNLSVQRQNFEYLSPSSVQFSEQVYGNIKLYYSFSNDFSSKQEFLATDNLNIGTYYFYAEIAESLNFNRFETSSSSFEVTPFDIQNATITLLEESYDFTGLEIKPEVTLKCKDESVTLVLGQDYTVSYENNIYIGTAKVVATGTGNFTGTKEKDFQIVKGDKPCESHIPSDPVTENYKKPSINSDGTWNDGSKDIVVYCKVCGTELSREHITIKKPNTGEITLEYRDVTYNGSKFTPKVNMKALKLGTDYTVNYLNNTNAGDASVIIRFIGDYEGTYVLNFNINPIKLEMPEILGTYTYNGLEQTAKLSYESDKFEVSGETQTNAGEYIVDVTLKDDKNYTWTNGTNDPLGLIFTIQKADVEEPTIVGRYIYNGKEQKPKLSYESDLFDAVISTYVNAGFYQINVTLNDLQNYKWKNLNYSGTFTLEFVIEHQKIEKPEIVGTYTYNGNEQTAKFSYESNLFESNTRTYTNAGEYDIQIWLTDPENYIWDDETFSDLILVFTIQRLDLSDAEILLDNEFFAYTGKEITPEVVVKLNGNELVLNSEYTLLFKNNVSVGQADVIVSGMGNFSGQAISHFVIGVEGIVEPTLVGTYTYNGEVQTAKLSYTSDKFTVSGASQKNAGKYEIIISLKDKANNVWAGTKNSDDLVLTFVIEKFRVKEPKLVGEYFYTGSSITPIFENESDYYKIQPYDIKDAGEYYLTVVLNDQANYIWEENENSENLLIEIVIKKIEVEEPIIVGTYIYDGTEKTAKLSYTSDVFTVTGDKQTFAGNYKVQVSLKDKNNYIWKEKQNSEDLSLDFVIGYNDFSSATVSVEDANFTYTGREIQPKVTVSFDGKVLQNGFDYKVEYSDNINAGTAKITIYGMNNYSGTIEKTFEIQKAKLEKPTILGEYTYNKTEQTANLSYNSDKIVVSNNKKTNAGTTYVLVSIADLKNYVWEDGTNDELKLEFIIKKASVSEPAISGTYTYTGSAQTIKLSYESDLFSISNNVQTNAGTYSATVSLTDKDNYMWKKSNDSNDIVLEFTIDPYMVQEPEVNLEFVYNGETQIFAESNKYYNVSNGTGKDAGNYEVVVSLTDKENYVWKSTGNTEDLTFACKISVQDLKDALITLEYESVIYTGENFEPQILSVVVNGRTLTADDYDVSYTNNVNAGTASVVITGKNNYTGTATKSFVIEKAEISDEDVILSANSATYNGANLLPKVTVTFNGNVLVQTRDYQVVWTNENLKTVSSAVDAGKYTAEITGKNNYNFSVVKTFEILKAPADEVRVVVQDTYIGQATRLNIEGKAYGDVVFYYKNINDEEYTTYTDEVYLPVGKYVAYIVVAETQNYLGTQSEKVYFEVKKYDRVGISISKDSYILGESTDTIIWGYDGDDIVLYYFAEGETEKDAKVYDNSTNFDAGTYYIFAVIPESEKYYEYKTTIETFTVSTKTYETEITVSRENYKFGKSKSTTILNGYNGDLSKVKLYYNVVNVDLDGTIYTDSDEFNAGTYYIYAVIEAHDGYSEYKTALSSFTVLKGDLSGISVKMENSIYGEALAKPTLSVEVLSQVNFYYNDKNSKQNSKLLTNNLVLPVGTYYVYAVVCETQNYNEFETELVQFKVTGKIVAIPTINNVVYNGKSQIALESTSEYTVSNAIFTNAGTYSIELYLVDELNTIWDDGTNGTKILTFVIEKLDISNCDVELDEELFVYDSFEKKPNATVKFNDDVVPVSEYSVSYNNNVNAGTAQIKITANNSSNFKGFVTLNYTINKADYSNISVSKASHNYGKASEVVLSSAVYGKVTYYYNTQNVAENGIEFTNETVFDAGVYYIYALIAESENYNAYKTSTAIYEVYKLDLNLATVKLEKDSYFVTGTEIEPKISSVLIDEFSLELEKDYTVSYSNNINIGTASIILTASENSNYSGTKIVYFEILAIDLSESVIEFENNQSEFNYTGDFISPNITVSISGNVLVQNRDYTVAYDNNLNVGTAIITISGIGNYTGTKVANFEIVGSGLESAEVYFLVSGNKKTTHSLAYSAGSKITTVEKLIVVEIGGVQISSSDYEVVWTKNGEVVSTAKDVGTYILTITEKAGGSFSGTASTTLTFKITTKPITSVSQVALTKTTLTATGEDLINSVDVRVQTDKLRKDIDYSIVWKDSSGNIVTSITEAGTYTAEITILKTGNYSYSKTITKTLTVN